MSLYRLEIRNDCLTAAKGLFINLDIFHINCVVVTVDNFSSSSHAVYYSNL
jgi:hypothetical protein